jgi:hypothetical protein
MHIHLKTFHLQINTVEVEIVEKCITLFKVHNVLNYSYLAIGCKVVNMLYNALEKSQRKPP